MNLLKFKSCSMLLAMAAALSLTACREEVLPGDDGTVSEGTGAGSGKVVYLTAGIALPTSAGTRSGTDENDPTGKDDDLTNSDIDKGENGLPDYEYGYDYENDVRTMILVAASKEENEEKYHYLFHTVITEIAAEPQTKAPFSFYVNGEIKYEDLQAAYGSSTEGEADGQGTEGGTAGLLAKNQTAYIFVYCNYTGRLLDYFTDESTKPKVGDTNWIDGIGEVEEAASPAGQSPAISNTIWAPRSFLMTNAQTFTVKFPAKIEDWEPFADKSHPYLLTDASHTLTDNSDKNANSEPTYDQVASNFEEDSAIRVERVAARLDFRDGSADQNQVYPLTINTERVIINVSDDGERTIEKESNPKKQNLFSIQLTRMSLVNMSKHFYYFRRVSDNGLPEGGNYRILGREYGGSTKANYVVDTDWKLKQNATKYTAETTPGDNDTFYTSKNAAQNTEENEDHFKYRGFNFALYDADNNYARDAWYTDDIKTVLKGKDDTWSGSSNNQYHIWRYVTENTIPQTDLNQTTVQSTGIVFKGAIIPGTHFRSGFQVSGDNTIAKENEEPYLSEAVQKALWAAKHHLIHDDEADNDLWTNMQTDGEEWDEPVATEYNYPILYSFEGMLYAGVEEIVIGAALDGTNGSLYTAVTKILSNWKYDSNEKKFTIDEKEGPSDAQEAEPLTVEAFYDFYNYNIALEKAKAEKSDWSDSDKTDFDAEYAKKNGKSDWYIEGLTVEWGKEEGLFENQFMKLAPEQNITIYKASDETDGEGWGYYCYYFYWNRHNDNGKSGEMGPMEFATVRNNVYKLAVTGINSFGHPRVTVYDPDPEKPWDPDEPRLRYIQVQVEVLPWVVRVNDIEF